MKKIYGNIGGLKADRIRRLENLYRRRIPTDHIITHDLARELSLLSDEIKRQIGLLIDRQGKVAYVIAGDHQKIVIPEIKEYRIVPDRLRGLRCVHTHLNRSLLSTDDLTDLALLRLDVMAAVVKANGGRSYRIHWSHILPDDPGGKPYEIPAPLTPDTLNIGCLEFVLSLENELARKKTSRNAGMGKERAFLISVSSASKKTALDSLEELRELAKTGGMEVTGTVVQQRKKVDTRFLIGTGKLQELTICALQKGATIIIFDQELNPSQIRSITDRIEVKVIDRTQLILDIFAQRALSREGKLQVELAQMKYLLPRLITKNTAMSRLTGGIGGRGPGETKLEINRRRVRDRIKYLEKALDLVKKQRANQKTKRYKKELPIISLVGYTNAGKSTLLNTLTKSEVKAENRLFETLDPTSRRLKLPKDREVIVTDTVGFIKDLPKELMLAFRATLEELEKADLLLHVIDVSNPRFDEQIGSVEHILSVLNLNHIPVLSVLNKIDLVDPDTIRQYAKRYNGITVSAVNPSTLTGLIESMIALTA